MKNKKVLHFSIFSLLFLCIGLQLKSEVKVSQLAHIYRKWLQEEAAYIITSSERKVFLQLDTDRERDMFIETFWKQRDPNPNTVENEYKIEHIRRLKYANETLGRGSPSPGWRTDMGRIYIILGEPKTIERYENMTEVYPTIVWFFQGFGKYGLPDAFSVVFFKPEGSGDYVIYSPLIHGPQKLLVNYMGDVNDYVQAYNEMSRVNPNLARVSISLLEGDDSIGVRPSIASDLLVQKQIPEVPAKAVNDEYAAKLLKYKAYIDVEYSVNYIPNSSLIRVIRGNSDFFFVHYLIEPQKLSLEQYDKDFFANLEINGSALDANDRIVYEFTKTAPIKLQADQVEKIKDKLFSFQDMFPLIEGKYKIYILVRNSVSKEFTSIEKEVVIPAVSKIMEQPWISELILANTAKRDPKYSNSEKSFLFNGVQLLPSPRNDFIASDTLYVYFQLSGLTPEQLEKGHIIYTLYKDDQPIKTTRKNLENYTDKTGILEEFSLAGYTAAYYNLRASVYGNETQSLVMGEESFYISPVGYLPRPWVVSLSSPADSPDNLNKLGIQYANCNEDEKSLDYLRRAYNLNPTSPTLAADYCRILNKLKMYQKVLDVGAPFMQSDQKQEFYALLGLASQSLGQYEQAVSYFKDYLAYHGTNLRILNAIGICYQQLGNIDEALVAWEKSLEIFPNQPELKTYVESLKKSKTKSK
ncbi:MAG: GWxTD domain-containing protein [Candidatus Aminicenantes bacterium]|nr:GWxTD domain-containing protein [Candidatus Aminicenantes bacterium]